MDPLANTDAFWAHLDQLYVEVTGAGLTPTRLQLSRRAKELLNIATPFQEIYSGAMLDFGDPPRSIEVLDDDDPINERLPLPEDVHALFLVQAKDAELLASIKRERKAIAMVDLDTPTGVARLEGEVDWKDRMRITSAPEISPELGELAIDPETLDPIEDQLAAYRRNLDVVE